MRTRHSPSRSLVGALCSVAVLSTVLCAPIDARAQSAAPSSLLSAEQQILAIDDAYVAAELSHDEAAMRRMIDDRFVYNAAQAKTWDKDEFIAHVAKLPMVGQTIRERTVLVEGDIGFVFATTDLRFASPGKAETTATLRYTCAFVRRQGQWKMLVLQMQPRGTH